MSEGGSNTRLNVLLAESGQPPLDPTTGKKFEEYLLLLLRWNARTNLTAIRDEEGILRRHFVESIIGARVLPTGIDTLLDFGSGAGFPGVPIALCRPEISVTLAESQGKKAAFLREVCRTLKLSARVHAGRAEKLSENFDCVVLRAVDRMGEAVSASVGLMKDSGFLGLWTTEGEAPGLREAAGERFSWQPQVQFPGGDRRALSLGQRVG